MKKQNQDTLYLDCTTIPKVLMLGNGINRAYNFASWDDLIKSIQTKVLTADETASLEQIPYPMRPVILTDDHLGTQMQEISGELSALKAPCAEENLLRQYADLPVDTIITANYSYELEKTLKEDFSCLPGRRCKYRKVAYSESGKYNIQQLHTYYVPKENLPIWHVHGEAARPDTMILGHYYYGKLLAKMQQYVSTLIARYKTCIAKQQPMEIHSWLDYFMLGDVYIVGLGMALSELDLWWLINCKKRHFPDRKTYLYKPDIHIEEKLLAEAYGVIVDSNGYNGDYPTYYQYLYEHLMEIMTS